MAPQTQTITVDRISNNGNAIAQQQYAGKTVLVPAGEVGIEYDVRLVDQGSHFEAQLVDRTKQTQASQPSISPDTSNLGKGRGKDSYSYKIRSSPAGGRLRGIPGASGKEQRRRLSQRKL